MITSEVDGQSRITVLRLWGGRDPSRRYRVIIDGSNRGRVRPGELLSEAVEPGRHTVRVALDWTGSPEREVTVAQGADVVLVCRAKSPLASPLQALSRDRWIELEVTS